MGGGKILLGPAVEASTVMGDISLRTVTGSVDSGHLQCGAADPVPSTSTRDRELLGELNDRQERPAVLNRFESVFWAVP